MSGDALGKQVTVVVGAIAYNMVQPDVGAGAWDWTQRTVLLRDVCYLSLGIAAYRRRCAVQKLVYGTHAKGGLEGEGREFLGGALHGSNEGGGEGRGGEVGEDEGVGCETLKDVRGYLDYILRSSSACVCIGLSVCAQKD